MVCLIIVHATLHFACPLYIIKSLSSWVPTRGSPLTKDLIPASLKGHWAGARTYFSNWSNHLRARLPASGKAFWARPSKPETKNLSHFVLIRLYGLFSSVLSGWNEILRLRAYAGRAQDDQKYIGNTTNYTFRVLIQYCLKNIKYPFSSS